MTLFQAIILGILQGATEFLPVSSSGHLVLVPWLLGWREAGESDLAFNALLHMGTMVAVVGFFWRDLWRIGTAVWDGVRRRDPMGERDARLGWFILAGSIPAALAGFLLADWFERIFGNPLAVSFALMATAAMLSLAEWTSRHTADLGAMGWLDTVLIGFAQALAIIPGISRSGATISAGLNRGVSREEAARFSFLLGVPVIVGAGAYQLLELSRSGSLWDQAGTLVTGFVAAAAVGYLAIHTLLLYVRKRPLYPFALYCALFGLFSLVVYVVRG